ncbi:hypothetical protein B296_00027668 [Ensete ventricosum]|uniref:Uncharacterized protein n=1 Tax=Ensete ventricosum TaxID=4639 RepID=A0A427A224_ENSVE|nr:hypothetical protein B296_00027668 [Ensete ventricosum]
MMQWELTERLAGSLPKVSEDCREFTGSSSKGSEACLEFVKSLPKVSEACRRYQKLVDGIESLLGVRRELAEGDRELARMTLGVHRKKTKRLAEGLLEVDQKACRKLGGSSWT